MIDFINIIGFAYLIFSYFAMLILSIGMKNKNIWSIIYIILSPITLPIVILVAILQVKNNYDKINKKV